MKTKMMMGFAALTLFFVSCQNEDRIASEIENPDVINFTTNTTRASIADLPLMMDDPMGFKVYATSPASSSAWFPGIDGTASYRYMVPSWGWSAGSPQWPITAAGYPMNFYAYYPASASGFMLNATATSMLSGAITVQNAPSMQSDYLAANAMAATKPLSGKLSMTFNHIMSKINFGVIAGSGMTVKVQSLVANNLKNTGMYNYLTQSWNMPSGNDSYVYYGTYLPSGTGGTSILPTFQPAVADEMTANPFYAIPNNNHLMLMPQTTPCWDKSAMVANAYIGAIYRISTPSDPNAIGYASAANHPNYVLGSPYTGPLFVKVGFPFASGNLVWDKAKGYTYNLLLGTLNATNGYLVDTFYYDENGNRTLYPILQGKTIGDPVTDGTINFNVVVSNWTDLPPVTAN